MRRQYYELVAEIVEKKNKLAEALVMKERARSALESAIGFVKFGEASLRESEGRLLSLENTIFGSEA